VAINAIRGEKTLSQLGSHYKVHPVQIAKWSKTAMELLPEPFVDGRTKKGAVAESGNDVLYEEIGRLKVELDWLKKKSACSTEQLRRLVDRDHAKISVAASAQPAGEGHRLYPCLLKGVEVDRFNQVWSNGHHLHTDGGGLRLSGGGDGLVQPVRAEPARAVNDGTRLYVEALKSALRRGRAEIFNSDQGSQFTSEKFTGELAAREIAISMDGRGRCMDNIFIERLWRSLKYEEVYLKDYETVAEARAGIEKYRRFYNQERLHQRLAYRTPAAVWLGRG
jgi:putative transposase